MKDEELIRELRLNHWEEAADRLEALRAERDALKDRAFRYDIGGGFIRSMGADFVEAEFVLLLARAEKAEAEVARLREALQKILAEDDQPVCCGNGTYGDCANPPECCNQPIYGLDRAQSIARAALAPVEAKGGDDGR
ncbi:MAG: hypothetical protein INH37_13675 [Myxococcaceae bacterium]|nr:hypothetical protein [Myxococcaceae bacterium]